MNGTLKRLLALSLPPLLLHGCTATIVDPGSLGAQDILAAVARTYAEAQTYVDEGRLEEAVQTRGMTITTDRPFSIAFVRPDKFRFQFTDPNGIRLDSGRTSNISIVWRDGDDVQSWWDLNAGVQQHRDLATALTGPAGISRSAALITPALLLPGEVSEEALTDMPNARRLEDQPCGELQCFRIEGDFGDGRPVIWVDQSQYLVRRVENIFTVRDNRYFITLFYEPRIDIDVPDDALAFAPPQ
ncbi:MAG: hypothetical protein RLZZ385_2390 [Pseudomonadota bacterium]|jgi:outer membrane lipoprotein-sorting protein